MEFVKHQQFLRDVGEICITKTSEKALKEHIPLNENTSLSWWVEDRGNLPSAKRSGLGYKQKLPRMLNRFGVSGPQI